MPDNQLLSEDQQQESLEQSPEQQEQEQVDRINSFYGQLNIAELLLKRPDGQSLLDTIAVRVIKDFDIDKNSRSKWEPLAKKALDLATMVTKKKNTPFEDASNVVYPLMAQAGLNFTARALPEILQNGDVVKCRVFGEDDEGEKAARAERVSAHMSWQVMEEDEEWIDEMDVLLTTLPFTGSCFKKTYYDSILGHNVSEYISTDKCVVNMWAKSLEKANRITHIVELTPNEIEERVRAGIFLNIEYNSTATGDGDDEDAPKEFYEQHRLWDLDKDGYQEPYIITVCKEQTKVVRIVNRWDVEGVKRNDKGEILHINPVHYFTHFRFLVNPDGSFYGAGYWMLLGYANMTINTLINQLIDAGTRANNGGGFISAGLQLQSGYGGTIKMKQGQYLVVTATGGDIRNSIVELQIQPPSAVLFQLLGLLIDAAKSLGSNLDVLSGVTPTAGTPATTTMAMIEQGLKPIKLIYKHVYKSLKDEFRKQYRLNRLYLKEEKYITFHDNRVAIAKSDYAEGDFDIIPASDPNTITDMQRLLKAEALYKLRGTGLQDREIDKRYLEALNVSDINDLLPDENAQPQIPPEIQMEMDKIEIEKERVAIERDRLQLEIIKTKSDIQKTLQDMVKSHAESIKIIADAEAVEAGNQLEQYKQQVEDLEAEIFARTREGGAGNGGGQEIAGTGAGADTGTIFEIPGGDTTGGIAPGDIGGLGGMENAPGNEVVPEGITGEAVAPVA